ncbi:MAG: phosphoribosylglycinamide formyltransferase [Cocleimonas sp.]|nr:phosphoribosylglycinamide formyltransferase [Cocleimonas sp.]
MSHFRIVVLLSGKGSNLQAIIDQVSVGDIKAEIIAVISNRPDVMGLQRAEKAGIPNHVLEHTHFASREAFDQSLAQIIDSYEPDLIVLAGFMRILSDVFVEKFQGKLINIHPSLLPKYKGLHTHKQALENRDNEHGATVHFVIPELDTGKNIIQGIVPVKADDTEESLAKRVHKVEHIIYPKAIQWIIEADTKQLSKPSTFYLDK